MIDEITQILPKNLICEGSEIIDTCTDSDFGICCEELNLIANASAKRKNEFTTGRICVKKALEKLDITNFPILIDEHKLPVFPIGIVGSLAHTKDYCTAIVGQVKNYKSIGVDIENINKMRSSFFQTIFTEHELNFLQQYPEKEQLEKATVFFSAKESFFKMQFQITQQMLCFKDASCSIIDNKHLSVKILKNLSNMFAIDSTFNGLYWTSDKMVFTAMLLKN